jgi:transposase-like protein
MVRKQFGAKLKAKVALEAIKGEKTFAQLSSEYGVHANRISCWRKQLQERVSEIFSGKKDSGYNSQQELIDKLYRNIGELKVENDWLKKNLGL